MLDYSSECPLHPPRRYRIWLIDWLIIANNMLFRKDLILIIASELNHVSLSFLLSDLHFGTYKCIDRKGKGGLSTASDNVKTTSPCSAKGISRLLNSIWKLRRCSRGGVAPAPPSACPGLCLGQESLGVKNSQRHKRWNSSDLQPNLSDALLRE